MSLSERGLDTNISGIISRHLFLMMEAFWQISMDPREDVRSQMTRIEINEIKLLMFL